MNEPRARLGEMLVAAGLLTEQELQATLRAQRADGRRLGTLLVERGLVSEVQLAQVLSQQLSVPWVSLSHIAFSRDLLGRVPRDVAERYCIIPVYVRNLRDHGDTLYVAMDDPTNDDALQACAASSGLPARAMIASPTDIRHAIRVYYDRLARSSLPGPRTTVPASQSKPASLQPDALAAPRVPRIPSGLPTSLPAPRAESAPASAPSGPASAPSGAAAAPSAPAPVAPVASPAPASSRAPASAPVVRPAAAKQATRGVSLTLLDGTKIEIPTGAAASPGGGGGGGAVSGGDWGEAFRAIAAGADPVKTLAAHPGWEQKVLPALLAILLRKHLVLDWELVEELSDL